MAGHEAILRKLYPSKQEFQRLLPQGNSCFREDLSKYGIDCIGRIGSGSFANVYRARMNGQDCACKVTHLGGWRQNSKSATTIAEYTLRELELQQKLRQEGVRGIMPLKKFFPSEQTIRAYIEKAKDHHIIMPELVVVSVQPLGIDYTVFMEQLFKSRRKLTEAEWAALVLDILQPLSIMHTHGVVHRDTKPQNLLVILLPNGQIRVAITDFNVSKEFYGEVDHDYTKVYSETWAHPAIRERPSRSKITRQESINNDIYAVGQIAYRLLNANVMAPCCENIPAPRNSPSPRVTALLRAMLNIDIYAIPSSEEIIRELKQMVAGQRSVSRPAQQSGAYMPYPVAKPRTPKAQRPSEQFYVPQPSYQKRKHQPQPQWMDAPFEHSFMDDVFDDAAFDFPAFRW